jgi:hypothetical protein
MIEQCADGKYKCFKCRKKRPLQSFMYDGSHWVDSRMAMGERKPEDVFKDSVDHGHAWACEECFMTSGFIRALQEGEDVKCKPSKSWPEKRYEDLTKCICCQMYWPFWDYSCFNRWHVGADGNRVDVTSPEPLHAFIREKRLIWGCDMCYIESGLRAIRKEGNVRWRAYKGSDNFKWSEYAKACRERGDYHAID